MCPRKWKETGRAKARLRPQTPYAIEHFSDFTIWYRRKSANNGFIAYVGIILHEVLNDTLQIGCLDGDGK